MIQTGNDLRDTGLLSPVVAVLDAATLKRPCDPTEYLGAADHLVQRALRAGSAG